MSRTCARAGLTRVTALALAMNAVGASAQESGRTAAAAPETLPAVIDACRNLTDAGLRAKLAELASQAVAREMGAIDYQALVESQWVWMRMNETLDQEIDAAVAAISADAGLFDRVTSLVDSESAGRFAAAVADRVYAGEGLRNALTILVGAINEELDTRIEKASDRIASPAFACLQSALRSRYGVLAARQFVRGAPEALKMKLAALGQPAPAAGAPASSTSTFLIVSLAMRQEILREITDTLIERIAGTVASRVAASVTGLLGLALAAFDLLRLGHGIFPIVAERMKSDEAKALVKKELARSLEAGVREKSQLIGEKTADVLYASWEEVGKGRGSATASPAGK